MAIIVDVTSLLHEVHCQSILFSHILVVISWRLKAKFVADGLRKEIIVLEVDACNTIMYFGILV